MMTAKEIEKRYDIEFEQIGCDKDHVHILCTAHPKIAPGQIVRVFKKALQRENRLRKAGFETKPVERRVLDGWLLCCNCRGKSGLGCS